MINSISLEGYVTNAPVKKVKYEGEKEYICFDIVHYSKFGGSIRLACISTNPKTIAFIQDHVNQNDRVVVFGSYNQYNYKNPAGEDKITHSIIVNSYDGVKLLEVMEKEKMDQEQKIGFPGERIQEAQA